MKNQAQVDNSKLSDYKVYEESRDRSKHGPYGPYADTSFWVRLSRGPSPHTVRIWVQGDH